VLLKNEEEEKKKKKVEECMQKKYSKASGRRASRSTLFPFTLLFIFPFFNGEETRSKK